MPNGYSPKNCTIRTNVFYKIEFFKAVTAFFISFESTAEGLITAFIVPFSQLTVCIATPFSVNSGCSLLVLHFSFICSPFSPMAQSASGICFFISS